MSDATKLWMNLSDEDLNMLYALQREMGASSLSEVMHALIRQAYTRASITCPSCGHSAQLTAADEARCDSCMSVLHLSDQIWQVVMGRSDEA